MKEKICVCLLFMPAHKMSISYLCVYVKERETEKAKRMDRVHSVYRLQSSILQYLFSKSTLFTLRISDNLLHTSLRLCEFSPFSLISWAALAQIFYKNRSLIPLHRSFPSCGFAMYEFCIEIMVWIRLSWSVLACLTYVNINVWKSSSGWIHSRRHECNSISPVFGCCCCFCCCGFFVFV